MSRKLAFAYLLCPTFVHITVIDNTCGPYIVAEILSTRPFFVLWITTRWRECGKLLITIINYEGHQDSSYNSVRTICSSYVIYQTASRPNSLSVPQDTGIKMWTTQKRLSCHHRRTAVNLLRSSESSPPSSMKTNCVLEMRLVCTACRGTFGKLCHGRNGSLSRTWIQVSSYWIPDKSH